MRQVGAPTPFSYLLGAMVRNMIEPLDRDEVAMAVTALIGVRVDPTRC